MQLTAVRTLLLGLVAWKICGVELRLCDDRIVFPDDNGRPAIYTESSSTTSTTSTTSTSSTTSTTSTTISSLTMDNNSTTTTESPLDNSTLDALHPQLNGSTTELPTLDNRILVDTLPICPPGQKLRAGRCRNSA